jgi:urease accessory protein
MCDGDWRCNVSGADALQSIRAIAGTAMTFRCVDGVSRLADLEERGGFRVKFPKGDYGLEAVMINTGGGMLGGDQYHFAVTVGPQANVTIASQSAERVYRAVGAATDVVVSLSVASGAVLAWLPQETLLYSGARVTRRIEADVASDARLLLAEAIVFGRAASGETVTTGALGDRWQVRRDGALVFAEALRLDDDMHAALQSAAIGNGARAIATILYLAPDAVERRDAVREALGVPLGRAGVSAWNGFLVARFLADDSAILRHDMVRVIGALAGRTMPRVWGS